MLSRAINMFISKDQGTTFWILPLAPTRRICVLCMIRVPTSIVKPRESIRCEIMLTNITHSILKLVGFSEPTHIPTSHTPSFITIEGPKTCIQYKSNATRSLIDIVCKYIRFTARFPTPHTVRLLYTHIQTHFCETCINAYIAKQCRQNILYLLYVCDN